MSWSAVSNAIRTQLSADTGSGGLFGSTPLLSAVHLNYAPEQADAAGLPYAVISATGTITDDVFASANQREEVGFQVTVVSVKRLGQVAHTAAVERIRTRLRRVNITPANSWGVAHIFLESEQPCQVFGELLQTTLDFTVSITKG